MSREAVAEGAGGRLIGVDVLADRVGVPGSVFAFIEGRIPELRAVREGTRRAYRAADATALAGLAELMYRAGVPFRDAAARLRTAREDVIARGEVLLGACAAPGAPASVEIPRDALVGARGAGAAAAPARAAALSPDVADVLGELIECLRLLEEARGPASTASAAG